MSRSLFLVFCAAALLVDGQGQGRTRTTEPDCDCEISLDDMLDVCWAISSNTFTATLTLSGGSSDMWVGFGFSEHGGMDGSDAVVSLTGEDPMQYNLIAESFVVSEALEVDPQQDLTEATRTENGNIVVTFSRPLNTHDDNDFNIRREGEIVWAYGAGPSLAYHQNRGHFDVDFYTCDVPSGLSSSALGTSAVDTSAADTSAADDTSAVDTSTTGGGRGQGGSTSGETESTSGGGRGPSSPSPRGTGGNGGGPSSPSPSTST